MEEKLKYLEFIQSVINRMASNSFLIKGWTLTMVAALFALTAKDTNRYFVLVAYLPCGFFWFLDAYFLRQERLYRKLYDKARITDEKVDFNLSTKELSKTVDGYLRTMFSITLRAFHGILFITVVIVTAILFGIQC